MKIPYIKINPESTTNVYWRTTTQDSAFILKQCELIQLLAPYIPKLNIKHPKYLKQSTGAHNTAASLCEGILENFNKSQFDLSEKQCGALVDVFKIGVDEIEDFQPVEFEEVDKLPKIKPPVQEDWSALPPDLFDIESVTVVYKKK